MNFNFQEMKPLLQREFDDVLASYPTDLSAIREAVPVGGDPYVRKRAIWDGAVKHCPVYIFPHFPFAFAMDAGEPREICYQGIGNLITHSSGVDFDPLYEYQALIMKNAVGQFGTYTDYLHRTMDQDKLLTLGFKGIYAECEEYNRTETDPEKKRFRELVMDGCRLVKALGNRLRDKALELLNEEQDEDARYNLERIVNSPNTPWEPAGTFFDAMQSILRITWFLSSLDGVECNSYGPIDRLLQPYYEKEVKAGTLSREEAYFLLQCFLHRVDLHVHYNEHRKVYDNGTSVMIGGCDLTGKPLYNDITDLVLDAYTENRLIAPKLNARASADSPRAYLQRLAALMQTGNNNLVVENDDYIIPMFLRMGLSPEDARTYVGNGCQEVICVNQMHSRAFVYLSLPQILLDTLHYGRTGLPLSEAHSRIYPGGRFQMDSYEELKASFLHNLRCQIAALAEVFAPYERINSSIHPEPILSALTGDCVASGVDLAAGGARYNHKTLSFVGFGTLCDSLLSLKKAYGTGTTEQLFAAMDADFVGYEALRQKLQSSPNRFGHSEEADRFARDLSFDLAGVSRGIRNADGIEWRTSLFTYYLFKNYGAQSPATPDGRRGGEAFSRQMNMASLPELTAAAISMSALTEADFNDVGMFDISLPCTVAEDGAYRDALADYILAVLKLKIPVLQTNVADRKQLLEERANKGTHPELVVRICGYSAYFSELSADMQDEVIARLGA